MRILFIENDRELRVFFGLKLKSEFRGTIDIASTGKEAMKLLKTEQPYDVIVSDYFLSKGTGLDLLRFKIKNNIAGSFIFFCTAREEVPYSKEEYHQVDKFSFGLLCEKIRRLH